MTDLDAKLVARWPDRLLILLFVLFLCAPPIAWMAGFSGFEQLQENRTLAPGPAYCDTTSVWPAKLEEYYNDRFGFRPDLVHIYAVLLRKYLGASSPSVVIGKHGWTFYALEGIFEDFFGKSPLTDGQLKWWKEALERRRDLLAARNGHYLLVIVPNKNTIYPEELPDYIQAFRGRSRIQQLTEYLRKSRSPVDILDLHQALLSAKDEGLVYFQNDTHWNGRGYFTGYKAMCQALSRWYPDIRAQELGMDYKFVGMPVRGRESAMLGLPEEAFRRPSNVLVSLGTQRSRLGNAPFPAEVKAQFLPWQAPLEWDGPGDNALLIFHDSFMRAGMADTQQVPLAEHFARTMLVGMRPTDTEFLAVVEKFRPDVVIEERTERFFGDLPGR